MLSKSECFPLGVPFDAVVLAASTAESNVSSRWEAVPMETRRELPQPLLSQTPMALMFQCRNLRGGVEPQTLAFPRALAAPTLQWRISSKMCSRTRAASHCRSLNCSSRFQCGRADDSLRVVGMGGPLKFQSSHACPCGRPSHADVHGETCDLGGRPMHRHRILPGSPPRARAGFLLQPAPRRRASRSAVLS